MFSAQELDQFFTTKFKKQIADRYAKLKIMTEGDLQVWTWYYLRRFLRSQHAFSRSGFRVFNQPHFRDLHTFPDLAIFKDGRPWALMELKKKCHLNVDAWQRDKAKLLRAHEDWHLERCYVIWAARHGTSESVMCPSRSAEGVFVGVPIVLDEILGVERVKRLERRLKKWTHIALDDSADGVPNRVEAA